MAFLPKVLSIVATVLAVDGSYKMLATEDSCFSATSFVNDYVFSAPADGEVVGVEMEYVSGGQTCDYRNYPNTHWGCTISSGWVMMNVLQHHDDGSKVAVYPTSNTEHLTTLSTWGCSNGCTVRYSYFDGTYDYDSPSLVLMDEENPITVTTDDSFSLQTSEGCCASSTGDNSGTACAKVYFHYATDPTHCATTGCDDQLLCNTETGECERDCAVLHIDDFLLDCSAEWDSNTASSSAMAASIATNTADIATVTASAATNAAAVATNAASIATNTAAITTVTTSANTNAAAIATNTADIATVTGSAATNSAAISSNDAEIATNSNSIASNAASITALETEGNSVESRLSAIESTLSRMAIVSAHSSMVDVDAMTAADLVDDGSWTAMSLSGKDVAIVSLLAVNAVLMTSMAIVCCRKQRGVQKYQAVSIASD